MKRRTFVGAWRLWRASRPYPGGLPVAGHIDEGKPKYGGTLRVAFASTSIAGALRSTVRTTGTRPSG